MTAVTDLRSPTTRAIDDAQRRVIGATGTLKAKLGEAITALNRKLKAG